MNKRQIKTRNLIFNAFLDLLSTKNYNKITVQEILDKASVGRSTFYLHFETKDHLIKEFCKELFEHIFSEDMENECLKYSNKNDLESLIAHILYHLQKSEKTLRKILICENREIFIMYFKEYILNLVETQIISKIDKRTLKIPLDYLKNHIAISLIETIKWWMINKMEEKPEKIAKYYLNIIFPIL